MYIYIYIDINVFIIHTIEQPLCESQSSETSSDNLNLKKVLQVELSLISQIRAKREAKMEEQIKAPETEEANPAPVSNAGVGATAPCAIVVLAIKQSIATSRTTRM